MTGSQWAESSDAIAMLDFTLQRHGINSDSTQHRMGYRVNSELVDSGPVDPIETQLHRFYVACCRKIWKLLPDSESRSGVEVAEKWLDGNATDAELEGCDRGAEGAAFGIDYNTFPDELSAWILEVDAIPASELKTIIYPPALLLSEIDTRELLRRAAYFAHFAIMYPAMQPKGLPPENYHLFLSPDLLRQHIQYPA